MLDREINLRFSGLSLVKALFLSPAVVAPALLLLYLPWDSPNAPAWVQAVGSIAAIFAAWLIPFKHEQLRIRKQKDDLISSVAWLALRVKNSFDHMESVIQRSEPEARDRWLFVSAPAEWAIHRDAAREFPLTGFTSDEISWLLSIRSVTEFGVACAELLRSWDFDENPYLPHDFPYNDGIVFHRPKIDWALQQLSQNSNRGVSV